MKTLMLFLTLAFAASSSSNPVNDNGHDLSSTYHYGTNVSVKNFDGTRSTIDVNWSSATLFNPDGTQSIIEFRGKSSNLIEIDGSISQVISNGSFSTIIRADGTQMVINHMPSTSSCYLGNEKHTIMHTFGAVKEIKRKKRIDILLHCNWFMKKKVAKAIEEESNKEEEEK